jgi:hypothetical protein
MVNPGELATNRGGKCESARSCFDADGMGSSHGSRAIALLTGIGGREAGGGDCSIDSYYLQSCSDNFSELSAISSQRSEDM